MFQMIMINSTLVLVHYFLYNTPCTVSIRQHKNQEFSPDYIEFHIYMEKSVLLIGGLTTTIRECISNYIPTIYVDVTLHLNLMLV